MKCRNWACGCEAEGESGIEGCPVYCDMCEQYTPICPMCCAVYGEHRPDCTVADGYTDCGEGPWNTEADARHFADAEVGVAWDVVQGNGKWYVVTKEERDCACCLKTFDDGRTGFMVPSDDGYEQFWCCSMGCAVTLRDSGKDDQPGVDDDIDLDPPAVVTLYLPPE